MLDLTPNVDIEFPDDIWDKSWAEIMEFIKTNLKA